MKRTRNLGLAAMTALALMASIGAASASASQFVTSSYPATVQGTPEGTHTLTLAVGFVYNCSPSPTVSGAMEGPTASLKTFAVDASCTSSVWGKATLEFKGCGLVFHPGASSFDIGPANCGSMVLNGATCDRVFSPQTLRAVTYSNEGEGSKAVVKVHANATGMEYTQSGECPSKNGVYESGTYSGYWTFQATKAGTPVSLQVQNTGAYMAGEKSEEKAKQPRFEAEKFPVSLFGAQDSANKHVLTIQARKLTCKDVQFDSKLTAAAAEIPVGAEYGRCGMIILGTSRPATVAMNSCSYVFHVLNLGPPYSGQTDVACSKEGDAIEIKAYESLATQEKGETMCTYKIGSQKGLEGLGLSTSGAGSGRGIAVNMGLSGITYSTTGIAAACGTSGNKATYAGGMTLLG